MSKQILCLVLALSLALLPGCSSSRKPTEEAATVPVAPQAGQADVSLADLLDKPRAELAKLANELTDRLRFQERSIQERRTELALLPRLRLPLVTPVWREAKFSTQLGFSLPPYATETGKDSVLALHLARFGDVEAARKIADPADAKTLAQIEKHQGRRNYPVEWTRLAALFLHEAQLRVAAGDASGIHHLAGLHKQLCSLLKGEASPWPLRAALLSRGKTVLDQSARAWQEQKRAEPAAAAEAAAKDWLVTFSCPPELKPGAGRAEVDRFFQEKSQGRALLVGNVARALDLLDLPVPHEGVRAVVACFDKQERLAEVLLTYREGYGELYPEPAQLALLITEGAMPTNPGQSAGGVRRASYESGRGKCEVLVVVHGAGVGAVVRWCESEDNKDRIHDPVPWLPREFGMVHLDRSFEQNRIRFAPEQRGGLATIKQPKVLAQFTHPVGAAKANQAVLQREADHDLTARLALQFPAPQNGATELHQLALPLWQAFGPCSFLDVNQGTGSHLALTWYDSRTIHTLRLPYARAPVEWEARDHRSGAALEYRIAETTAFDQKERQVRLQAGQPLTRIPRTRERLELGMKREQAQKVLPIGQAVHKRDIAGGILVTSTAEPAPNAAAVARQMVLRFDAKDQLTELRVRYLDGPAAKGTNPLADLIRRCGVSQEGPAPANAVWSDLPRSGKPLVRHHWQDDLTQAACVRDGNVTDVVLRDRSADEKLPPLEYLPRGPAGCVLDVAREDLLRQWNVTNPITLADGALVLTPQSARPYDALMVWFTDYRVTRIVARHDAAASRGPAPWQLAQAVSESWGRDLRTLGWPSRQDLTPQSVMQSLGWHDGVTRIRTFWQEQDDGSPRVYTEWKALGNP